MAEGIVQEVFLELMADRSETSAFSAIAAGLVAPLARSMLTPCTRLMVRASLRMLQRCVLMLLVASIAACGDDGVTAPSTETTETFSSTLAVGGWTSHSLSVLEPGTVTVTLDSISPAVVVGLGFGVFDGSVSGCTLMASIETAGGSTDQLVNSVESGTYCVKISDIGNLRQSASFSISISRS